MASKQGTGCVCRVPIDEVSVPVFATVREQFDWLIDHGVTDIDPDHMGRVSIPTVDALRLRRESDEQAERSLLAAQEARVAHATAVAELRSAVTAAFVEQTGGAAVVSPDGMLVSVGERRAGQVSAGLDAARAVWGAAPFEVRIEVNQLTVTEGDTTMSYDLSTVLPRATVEAGIVRAVARANRAAG